MAALAGLIAAIIVVAVTAGGFAWALELSGITTAPKWLIYGVVGISLSLGVTAFQQARKFALTRPALRYELGKTMLFLIGAAVLFGAGEIYSKWRTQEAQSSLHDALHNAMLSAQINLEQELPKVIDEHTTLVATKVVDTDWTYVYNLTTRNFDVQTLRRTVRRNVCTSNLKDWIAKGVSYSFEYWDTSVNLLATVKVASCP